MRCLVTAVALLAASVTVAACGGAPEVESNIAPKTSIPPGLVSGGTPQQRAIVRSALEQLGDLSLSAVTIGSPPAGFGANENSWLYYTIAGQSGDGERRATWKAMLVSGALADKGRELGLPDIEGETFNVASPESPPEERASARIGTRPGRTNVRATSVERLDELILEHAQDAGVTAREIEYLRPVTLAPIIRVTDDDADNLAASRRSRLGSMQEALASSEAPLVDGVFFEVVDDDGTVLSSGGYSARTAAGIGS